MASDFIKLVRNGEGQIQTEIFVSRRSLTSHENIPAEEPYLSLRLANLFARINTIKQTRDASLSALYNSSFFHTTIRHTNICISKKFS